MNKLGTIALTLCLGALAAGCASKKPPEVPSTGGGTTGPSAQQQAAQHDAVANATKDNEGGGLRISEEIMRLCPGIKPPKFGFDSAELQSDWADALHKLADCMNGGALAGRGVLLTGHTDPRGDDDYNMALGGRRAESVKKALDSYGVTPERVGVTSRGKADAVGTDDQSWARDRRVDIDLKPKGSASSGVSSN
jgi:peptidoglycan-associated lipoprotein